MRFVVAGMLAALSVLVVPAPAVALQTPGDGSPVLERSTTAPPPLAQRIGRGRGIFRPRAGRPGFRPGLRPRRTRPAPNLRRVGRDVLRFLGIAYLVHLLFGWGSGGSPLGLLLVLGFASWLVLRHRRRVRYPLSHR